MASFLNNSRIQRDPSTNPYSFNSRPPLFNDQNGLIPPNNYHNYANFKSNGSFPNPNNPSPSPQPIHKNEQPSFVRNFKARLFNIDPQQEQQRQDKIARYRQELVIQMEEQARIKKQRAEEAKQYDMKMDRKIQENIKIQAQKKNQKKDEPSYFMVRSSKGHRKNKLQEKDGKESPQRNNFIEENSEMASKQKTQNLLSSKVQIKKRGGYHNQSSLDSTAQNYKHKSAQKGVSPLNNYHQASNNNQLYGLPQARPYFPNPEQMVRQIGLEEERIAMLLIFQKNMLKKLDSFKKQISRTSNHLDVTKEIERVRFGLRAKPLNMEKVFSQNPRGVDEMFENNSDFYHLPLINKNKQKIYRQEKNEYKEKRVKNSSAVNFPPQQIYQSREEDNKVSVKLNNKQSVSNDKNFHQQQEAQEEGEGEGGEEGEQIMQRLEEGES